MSFRHTPGPWVPLGVVQGMARFGTDGPPVPPNTFRERRHIGAVYFSDSVKRKGRRGFDQVATARDMADFHMILAAPDLWAALKVMILDQNISRWLAENDPMALEQAQAAIAKAEVEL